MKLNLTPFLVLLVLTVLVSCGYGNQGANKMYYSLIVREKAVEQKDSLLAPSDLAAVDSTIRRFYSAINDYNIEKSKNVNNPYLLRPKEWHAVGKDGQYITSVSTEEIQELEKKYGAGK
jgi:hypothetical protein